MLTTELVQAQDGLSKRLLVALHGLGDSMEGYRWVPQVLKLPWLNYLLVNAPDAYYGGYSWYDFAQNPGPGIKRSLDLLFPLFERLEKEGYPTAQTVLFGFSQGCLMTIEVGLRYPKVFAGLVGVSGYAHEPEKLLTELSPVAREQRFLVTHGTEDPLIPFQGVREQIRMLQRAGLNIEWRQFVKEHTIAGEEEVDVIRRFILGCFQEA